ncbi:MAG: hypothetical protein AB7O97_21705 [Planctomycetota bacterium]
MAARVIQPGVGAPVVLQLRVQPAAKHPEFRGRIWWIQFRAEGRRVRESLGTDNKKLAEDLRRRRLVEVEAGRLQLVAVPAGGGLAESADAPEPRPVVDVETALADSSPPCPAGRWVRSPPPMSSGS